MRGTPDRPAAHRLGGGAPVRAGRRARPSGGRRLGVLAAAVWGLLLLVGVAAAEARGGQRVTVGVFGDSVVEGYTIPHYLRDSLVPQLRTGLARAGGFEPGGTGLIPVSAFRWRFARYTVAAAGPPAPPDAWVLSGFASYGIDGPSGYSAIAVSPAASATAPVDGPLVGVLFTKFAGSGVFTVTAGSRTYSIDARSSGPPAPAEQWITVPAGTRTITVHGPGSGVLVFDGVVVRRPVSAGRIGVEVENLGHMGHNLIEDSAPRILASIVAQRFDISVFLSSYIWVSAAGEGGSNYEAGYANELRTRVRLVRGYGGLCLIADPSPLPLALSAKVIARFTAIDRRVAGQEGCAYTGVLSHLWNAATAVRTGITLLDDLHPRARGYRLMAQALVPELVRLVRQRVRTRGG